MVIDQLFWVRSLLSFDAINLEAGQYSPLLADTTEQVAKIAFCNTGLQENGSYSCNKFVIL